MNVHPYRLLGATAAGALAARARTAAQGWADTYTALPAVTARCSEAHGGAGSAPGFAAGMSCRQRVLVDGSAVWVQLATGAERALERLLFDLPDSAPASPLLGAASVNSALEALLQALVQALCGQASAPAADSIPPPHLLRHGSGSVACQLTLGQCALSLLLPWASLTRLASPTARAPGTALVALHQALARVDVPLRVEICNTELTLGYLRTLQVGDVLALPVGLDQAMRLTGPGDTTVCLAHLGAQDGFHAVELMKTGTTPNSAPLETR